MGRQGRCLAPRDRPVNEQTELIVSRPYVYLELACCMCMAFISFLKKWSVPPYLVAGLITLASCQDGIKVFWSVCTHAAGPSLPAMHGMQTCHRAAADLCDCERWSMQDRKPPRQPKIKQIKPCLVARLDNDDPWTSNSRGSPHVWTRLVTLSSLYVTAP